MGGTVQVQRAARNHDAAVAHAGHDVLALHVVGEGDGGLAGVGLGFGADGQLAVQHDPLGGEFHVGVVREGELAVDRHAAQRRRIDVEDHVLVLGDGDLVTRGRHLVVGPGGRIRPSGRLGWRSCVLGLDDSEYAAEQDCRNQRCKKDRARSCTHGDYPSIF